MFTCPEHPQWEIQINGRLGGGKDGEIYTTCRRENCSYVAKLIDLYYSKDSLKNFETEVKAYNILEAGVAKGKPRVSAQYFDSFKCTFDDDYNDENVVSHTEYGVIIIENLNGTLSDKMEQMDKNGTMTRWKELSFYKQHLQLAHTLHQEYGIAHNDTHTENVMFRMPEKGGTMVFIDFARAWLRAPRAKMRKELLQMYHEDDYLFLTKKEANKVAWGVINHKDTKYYCSNCKLETLLCDPVSKLPFCGKACKTKYYSNHRCIHNHYNRETDAYYVDNLQYKALNNTEAGEVTITYQTDNVQTGIQLIKKGTLQSFETHEYETQFIYVVDGYGDVYLDPGEPFHRPLGPGESVLIPPGVAHALQATTDLRVLTLYSKHREDLPFSHLIKQHH